MDLCGGSSYGGPPDSTMLDMADPIPLPELEARMRRLPELPEVDQWREAKELIEISKASFQAFRDGVIYALTRDHTNEQVAKMLEIGVKQVEKVVTRFNKRPNASVRRSIVRDSAPTRFATSPPTYGG